MRRITLLCLVALLAACLPAAQVPADTSEVTIEGLFAFAIGDPAGGVGGGSYRAEVIDSTGTRYRVRADSAGGLQPHELARFSGLRVRVEGRRDLTDSLLLWITRIDSVAMTTDPARTPP